MGRSGTEVARRSRPPGRQGPRSPGGYAAKALPSTCAGTAPRHAGADDLRLTGTCRAFLLLDLLLDLLLELLLGVRHSQDAPTVFVLFGATGDLAKRMVLPAFYDLYTRGLLPAAGGWWATVAATWRTRTSRRRSRRRWPSSRRPRARRVEGVRRRGAVRRGRLRATTTPAACSTSSRRPGEDLGENVQLVHYLAIPPTAFPEITKAIGTHGLAENSRVVYEKPYGTSAESFARARRPGAHRVRRGAGVPDRPLPR